MNQFLWTSSTLVMAALLALLALRALRELLGIDLRGFLRDRISVPRPTLSRWASPALFIASLAILWLGAYWAYRAAHVSGGFFAHFVSRFTTSGDAPHYLYIAEHGYARAGEEINKIVFFPLYPLLTAGLGRLLGGNFALAGVIISQVCYGLSSVALYKLAKLDCPHPGAAVLAYWLYPLGFFCLGVFTEGLFLLLIILGFYLLRTRRWLLAGLMGLLCALTRTQGMLLLLPGVYCAWREFREKGWNWRFLALLGPAAGYCAYLILNKTVCGDFFAYAYYESLAPWWQTPQWLGNTIAQQLQLALQYPGIAKWIYWPQLLLYYIAAALLLFGYRRRLRTEHILIGTAYLGMSYTPSWLISGSRYMLGCFPLYLCVGSMRSRTARAAVLAIELLLFALFAYWFAQGQAIM